MNNTMFLKQAMDVVNEVNLVIKGKDEIVRKVLMAIIASGHVLLEDNPGSGKTTMAKAFAKAIDLSYKRQQFTPDTMPSDITGYTFYDKVSGEMRIMEGAVMCNLLLADEINRTSAKTQASLLESMEEKTVTLDGNTMILPNPFIVIATQNPITSLGTQPLPDSQCDRFMVKLSMGYPDVDAEMSILSEASIHDNTAQVNPVMSGDELVQIREYVDNMYISEELIEYICKLAKASREHEKIEVGLSTRGAIALKRMAAACAFLGGREYVIPSDIKEVFTDVGIHRVILKPQAIMEGITEEDVLKEIIRSVKAPRIERR